MLRGVVLGLAMAGLLAGCGNSSRNPLDASSAPCPRIAILADGADLTRFRDGRSRDLTAMVADARISGFQARCDYASRDRRALDVRVTPSFEAERGPAAEGRVVDLPWFVALSDANDTTVLERIAGTTRLTFAPNTTHATGTGRTVQLTLPLAEGQRAQDYIVRLSFQLTREEVALNRQRGPR